jgi:site-specific DNA recombinase
MKKYLAFARVSSREQEREGFSLDVQEDAFHEYARKHGGVVEKLFRIAETATRPQQRAIFREALAHAKKHAKRYDGLLFYKVDRAARNASDWIDLEKLASDYHIPLIFVTLPASETPNGKLMVRTLAAVATFQTEQQSLDVRDGIAKRVQAGFFPSHAPYGYRNVRGADKRSRIVVDEAKARAVRRAFALRATEHLTVDQIIARLHSEGMAYSDGQAKFPRTKMHHILRDRSYIGEISFHGKWHPGTHARLVDKRTWEAVQASFHNRRQKVHKLLFANGLVRCGICDRCITGEKKRKKTMAGEKDYVYYRCCRYTAPPHPRQRVKETDLDSQIDRAIAGLRFPSAEWQEWAKSVATEYLKSMLGDVSAELEEILRQRSLISVQREELLNLRLIRQISDQQFGSKSSQLRERETLLANRAQALEAASTQVEQKAQTAAFLFDTIRQRWGTWDVDSKHLVLRLVFGGFKLDGDRLVQDDRTPIELFRRSPF